MCSNYSEEEYDIFAGRYNWLDFVDEVVWVIR